MNRELEISDFTIIRFQISSIQSVLVVKKLNLKSDSDFFAQGTLQLTKTTGQTRRTTMSTNPSQRSLLNRLEQRVTLSLPSLSPSSSTTARLVGTRIGIATKRRTRSRLPSIVNIPRRMTTTTKIRRRGGTTLRTLRRKLTTVSRTTMKRKTTGEGTIDRRLKRARTTSTGPSILRKISMRNSRLRTGKKCLNRVSTISSG